MRCRLRPNIDNLKKIALSSKITNIKKFDQKLDKVGVKEMASSIVLCKRLTCIVYVM